MFPEKDTSAVLHLQIASLIVKDMCTYVENFIVYAILKVLESSLDQLFSGVLSVAVYEGGNGGDAYYFV